MTKVINKVVEDLTSEFTEVRKLTDDLFKTLSIEDAVIQSDPFGSYMVFSQNTIKVWREIKSRKH